MFRIIWRWSQQHHAWNPVFSLVHDINTRWNWSVMKHVYLLACCIVCTAMPVLCAKFEGQYLIQTLCNYDLNKSQMNIIEILRAHLFHLHSIYQQLLGLTDTEELLTYQLNWALYKLTCESPWFWCWQGPLAALIMDSVGVCVYQPSPFSTSLATTPRPPAGRQNVPEQKLEATREKYLFCAA